MASEVSSEGLGQRPTALDEFVYFNINRLAVVVSPRNDRVRTNGRTTQKRAQLVVGQVGRAVRNGPLGLFSHGQSPEMSGLSTLHTQNK